MFTCLCVLVSDINCAKKLCIVTCYFFILRTRMDYQLGCARSTRFFSWCCAAHHECTSAWRFHFYHPERS